MNNEARLPEEIQDYIDFLHSSDRQGMNVITPQKVNENLEAYGQAYDIMLAYPDLFIDMIVPVDSTYELYFFQRILLRVMARHRQVYVTASRGTGKSFAAFLSRYLRSMMTPKHKSFVVADVKKQAARITREKIQGDLWLRFPLLANEMKKIPQEGGKKALDPFTWSSDSAKFTFTNHGEFSVVGSSSADRGGRQHSGIIEEVITQDATDINEIVIPLVNIDRDTLLGEKLETEPHAQKLFITTAGYQGTFAYDKMIENLCYSALDPDKYMTLAFSYRIAMMHGLLSEHTVREIMASPTFDRDSYQREYESVYSGSMKGAAMSYNLIEKARKIVRAENFDRADREQGEFYVVSADMAKDGTANTAVVVLKIQPREYTYVYRVVNGFFIEGTDYKLVSNTLKQIIMDYNAAMLVYDANGIGASLRDWINKPSETRDGTKLPGFGIINPPDKAKKDLLKQPKERTIIYEVKASGTIANEINKVFFARFKSGAVRMLITANAALNKMKQHKNFVYMKRPEQLERLQPYQFVDIMQKELLNLDIVDTSDNVAQTMRVRRRDPKIQKDTFSALSYGIYAVNLHFEQAYYKKQRRKKRKASDWAFVSQTKKKPDKFRRRY